MSGENALPIEDHPNRVLSPTRLDRGIVNAHVKGIRAGALVGLKGMDKKF